MVANASLLTRQETAESLRQSLRQIDNLIASGELPAVRIGRRVLVRPSAVERFVEAREARVKINIRGKGGRS